MYDAVLFEYVVLYHAMYHIPSYLYQPEVEGEGWHWDWSERATNARVSGPLVKLKARMTS